MYLLPVAFVNHVDKVSLLWTDFYLFHICFIPVFFLSQSLGLAKIKYKTVHKLSIGKCVCE